VSRALESNISRVLESDDRLGLPALQHQFDFYFPGPVQPDAAAETASRVRINIMKKFVGYTLWLGTHRYHLFECFTDRFAVFLYGFSRVSLQSKSFFLHGHVSQRDVEAHPSLAFRFCQISARGWLLFLPLLSICSCK
jgi:hypothetical protein